jgi:diacylglycerol O-acyltransferase
VTIPLDIRNPKKLLAAVHKRTDLLKRAHTAELVSLVGGVLGMIPSSAQAVAGHVISRLPFTPFNMVCTNVPGPQFPLYLLGHKILHCYPYVPVGGEMSLNCAILSYNGTAYFGFSGDAHAVPDLRRLETLLLTSFTELRDAAGVAVPRTKEEKTEEKKKAKKTVRAKATVAATKIAAKKVAANEAPAEAPVRISTPRAPLASAKSPLTPVPPVTEEKTLTQLIA